MANFFLMEKIAFFDNYQKRKKYNTGKRHAQQLHIFFE